MPKNITQTLYGATLDMTIHKKIGIPLKEQILQDVKDSQTFAGRHLPDKIILTVPQFESIEDDTERISEHGDRIFVTPLNCMEVTVAE